MKRIVMILIISLLMVGCNDKSNSAIQWTEKSVVIPKLQNDYEVWFLSDSHITKVKDTESEEIKNYASERQPVFTNEMGIESGEIFSQFIKEANEQKPDLVLFGGDILDFPSEGNLTFLKEELEKLTVPYLFVMGNHDWTYPWEYMTPEGTQKYRPLLEEIISADSYVNVAEFEDIVFLAIDDSGNQVAAEAVEEIERVYALDKPIVLVQHVPFSTEKLIARAKESWGNPVTLGMQVHGGLAPNEVSSALYKKVLDDESKICVVLAGHVHFSYEEQVSEAAIEIIADAAYKGNAVKVYFSGE